jgi:signal recognition particle receptor subunit beta
MVLFNYGTKEITAKIVYYGPGLCGKTTNLQYIHSQLDPGNRGKLLSLATESDRTLFFDFLPLDLGKISGFHVRFQLYTVPGQVHYNATRRMVLKGVDAVVFVADSQTAMMEHNVESFENLRENLEENGFDAETIPLVLQLNKRDLPNVAPPEEIVEALKAGHLDHFESVASTGEGVFETLKAIIRLATAKLKTEFKQDGLTEPAMDDFGPPPPPPPAYEPKPLFSADTPLMAAPGSAAQTEAKAAPVDTVPADEDDADTIALEDEVVLDDGVEVLDEETPAVEMEDSVDEFDLTDFDDMPEEAESPSEPQVEAPEPGPPPAASPAEPEPEPAAPSAELEEKVERLAGDVRRLQEENREMKKVLEKFIKGAEDQIDILRKLSSAAADAVAGDDAGEPGAPGD